VLDESDHSLECILIYFSNIPKCIKSRVHRQLGCSPSSVVSSSKR
ncbi:hypothetical protein TNCV_337011, partial [Trichonephila clavipes]